MAKADHEEILASATCILVALFLLAGCSKSADQLACEQSGGTWDTYIITYTTTLVYNGKGYVPMITPIYGTRCLGGAS